jgi:hypothetical protein
MDNEDQLSLENLMIAAPCDVDWNDMVGGETVRRCGECKLNVYNVTSMTRKEVEELLSSDRAKSGNLCVQLYRRADGTLLTKDCPRGLAKVRALSSLLWRTVAATVATFLAGGSAMAQAPVKNAAPAGKTGPFPGTICPPSGWKGSAHTTTTKTTATDQTHTPGLSQKKSHSAPTEDTHNGKAHFTAFNLYREGQQLEKSGAFAKAAEVYQQALTAMVKQKHDPKFHLKIETALSRVKAKAGINQ